MNSGTPPPVPVSVRGPLTLRSKLLISLACIPGILVLLLIVFRITGLLCLFNVPTRGMTPAVCAGDHLLMENIGYFFRAPRRGDVVVFETGGIEPDAHYLPEKSQKFIQRIAAEPGEHVRIEDGKLFINRQQVALSNAAGVIVYEIGFTGARSNAVREWTVPTGHFFLLGDNTTNSLDSRYWGTLPGKNIQGRAWLLLWPPQRWGKVK